MPSPTNRPRLRPVFTAGCLVLATAAALRAQPAAPAAPATLAPDLVLLHGRVETMDDRGSVVEAVAIRGEHIVALGSSAAIGALAGAHTRVLELGGRLVLPGFVDAHSHTTGISPDFLDLSEARSIGGIQSAIARTAATRPEGAWIVGAGPFMLWRGWDERRLAERRLVTRADLDPVSPRHPVLLVKEAGHALALNSRALERASIDRNTADPRGEIAKDAAGEPTGILLEGSMNLGFAAVPAEVWGDGVAAARHASDQLLGLGVTTVANMSMLPAHVATFQAAYRQPQPPLVTTVMCPLVPTTGSRESCLQAVRSWQVVTGFGDHRLKLGALKIFVDGGITGRAAWFTRPYKGRPGYFGIPQVDEQTLHEVVALADRLGWQIHLHTCGDAAVERALGALEAAQRSNRSSGRRHILTHLYVVSAEQMARMRRLGVVVVLQPNFVHTLGEHLREALDDEQLREILPFRRFLDAGVAAAIGADGLPQNPLTAVWAAAVRTTEAGNVLAGGEAVSVREAVRAYTRGSAWALFEEERRGSLEPGRLADLIVLDRDIFARPLDELRAARVVLTIKHGEPIGDL